MLGAVSVYPKAVRGRTAKGGAVTESLGSLFALQDAAVSANRGCGADGAVLVGVSRWVLEVRVVRPDRLGS